MSKKSRGNLELREGYDLDSILLVYEDILRWTILKNLAKLF